MNGALGPGTVLVEPQAALSYLEWDLIGSKLTRKGLKQGKNAKQLPLLQLGPSPTC